MMMGMALFTNPTFKSTQTLGQVSTVLLITVQVYDGEILSISLFSKDMKASFNANKRRNRVFFSRYILCGPDCKLG